jgi:hypothetical protein
MAKIGVFCSNYCYVFLQNFNHNIVFWKNAIFSPKIGKNRRKLWSYHRPPEKLRLYLHIDKVHQVFIFFSKILKTWLKYQNFVLYLVQGGCWVLFVRLQAFVDKPKYIQHFLGPFQTFMTLFFPQPTRHQLSKTPQKDVCSVKLFGDQVNTKADYKKVTYL